jgi:hypothetical protein
VHESVVHLGDGLHELLAVLTGLRLERLGDGGDVDLRTEVVAVQDRLHSDEVDHALEPVLGADRDLHRHGVRAQPIFDHLDTAPVVGTRPVELVDEADPRHAVAVGLAPDRLGLGLDACHAVEDDHGSVQNTQAALDLHREVHVPGRIDDVDAVLIPEAGRGRGRDGDAPLLLLGHPVHRGRALVNLAELVDLLGVEEDPLGDRRLPGIDVRDDPDVAGAREGDGSGHQRRSWPTT